MLLSCASHLINRATRPGFMAVLLVMAAAGITGCASAPPVTGIAPASDTQPEPAAPVKDVAASHKQALSLMAREDWHEAAQALEILTAARPNLSGPWVNLGIARTMTGDSVAAEAAFKRALDANAGNAEAYNQLGMLYRRNGRLEDARFIYNAGLEQDPGHADLHWNLAILHDRYLPQANLALAHYKRYRQLTNRDDPQLQHWIVQLQKQSSAPEQLTAEAEK